MFSGISSTKSMILYNNNVQNNAPVSFSSFPSSCICRYDANGVYSSTGALVNTNGSHAYKLINKQNPGTYDMISRSTDANKFNQYITSGLGTISKPCVRINATTISQQGYVTVTNHPRFFNGMEIFAVCKSNGDATNYRQTLICKTVGNTGNPNPFDIKFDNVFGQNNLFSNFVKSSFINWKVTQPSGNIYNINVLKSTGQGSERQNGVQGYNQVVPNLASYYSDSSLTPLYISSRPDNTYKYLWEISEIIVCDSPVTQSEREMIEGYLSTKWGIPLTNTSHPYYNKPVYYTGINP
jgi:hypothetical protein